MTEKISQELVRVADVPAANRFLSVVNTLPGIIQGAHVEQQGDAINRKMLKTLSYNSPFQRDAQYVSTLVAFVTKAKPKGLKDSKTPLPELFGNLKIEVPKEETDTDDAKRLGRRIARLLHPDRNDPIVRAAFDDDSRLDLNTRAHDLIEKPDAERGQRLFLDVMPIYYKTLIATLIEQGLSHAEIAVAHPEMIRDLELLRYISHVREPKQTAAQKTIEQEDAIVEAGEAIKRKSHIYDRADGTMKLAITFNNLTTFSETIGSDAAVVEQLTALRERLNTLGMFFISNALAEEISLGNFSDQATVSAAAMDEQLQRLPSDVIKLTASLLGIGGGRLNTSDILTDINERVEAVYRSAKVYYGEFSRAKDRQLLQANERLTEVVDEALGEEEKTEQNGVLITKKKESADSISDTQISWVEYSSEDREVSTYRTYILVDGRWWYREKRQRIYTRDGFYFFRSLDFGGFDRERNWSDIFTPQQFDLDGETGSTVVEESEKVKKAKQFGYELASIKELDVALKKIRGQKEERVK